MSTTTLGIASQQLVDDISLQRQTQKLHALGPRPLAEFLSELASDDETAIRIRQGLERYSRLDPRIVAALGGTEFPCRPHLTLVPK